MKNILILTRGFGQGGTENVILQIIDALKDSYNISVCSSGGINEEQLKRRGVEHFDIIDPSTKKLKNHLKNILKIKKIIKEKEIDIIHSHHRMTTAYLKTISSKIVKIHTMHNIFNDKIKFTNWVLKSINIIAVGDSVKQNLINDYGIDTKNITTIKNAVPYFDKKNFLLLNELQNLKRKNKILIANFGRLSEQKGFIYFLGSLNELKNEKFFDDLHYIIVGEGEDYSELKLYIEKNNLSSKVTFLGYRKDVQNIMSQVDIIVISSLWEGYPLVPIEAFSVKKPLIATNIPGTNEIANSKNSLLVSARNSKDIAKSIKNLLENDSLSREISENGFSDYNSYFSVTKFNKEYLEFYSKF